MRRLPHVECSPLTRTLQESKLNEERQKSDGLSKDLHEARKTCK